MRTYAFVLLLLFTSCAPVPPPPGTADGSGGQRVILTDRRGERWDITDAVRDYGFNRRHFEYGIGRHAIPPLNTPSTGTPLTGSSRTATSSSTTPASATAAPSS